MLAGAALVQWGLRGLGATQEDLRIANLGAIVFGNLLLWFRGRGVRHVHANSVFVALLAGVCAVWLLLTVLAGVGSLFGLPQAPSAWVLCAVAPAGWALWHLSAYRSRT